MKHGLVVAAAVVALATAALAAGDRIVVNGNALYPEGALADGNAFYYTEMGADRIMRWDGAANRQVWSRSGCGPTSVAHFGDNLLILCHIEAALAIISRDGQTVRMIDRDRTGRPFQTPNASISDGKGGVYLSSSGVFSPTARAEGAVMYLAPDGTLSRLTEGIHYSNGVALANGGKLLYVSEHLSRRILAFDVGTDASLSNKRVFARLDDYDGVDPEREWEVGPDGLATDREGNLYIAEYGAGHVLVVGPDARLEAKIDLPQQYVTAPALSPDERHIFITAPVSLYDPTEPGAVYFVANPLSKKD
jgi:sugar lactone lactonase YvrE